ncbi:MAG: RhuM family protein [Acholeplasma sp.]|nr:RhuM family protein [Acholeplasma sp.]
MAVLFDVDRTRITRHINNIYEEQELDSDSTSAENAHMGSLGTQTYKRKIYNLDMIISVGYRVNSKRGIVF